MVGRNADERLLHRSTALGSALLAGSAINLFGWDLAKPETLAKVNTLGVKKFAPSLAEAEREAKWDRWQKAVKRSLGWDEAPEED